MEATPQRIPLLALLSWPLKSVPWTQDPAKMESCILFMYTALPITPDELYSADIPAIKWWLDVPGSVAEALRAILDKHGQPPELSRVAELLKEACATAGLPDDTLLLDEAMRRISSKEACQAVFEEAAHMIDVLCPWQALSKCVINCFLLPSHSLLMQPAHPPQATVGACASISDRRATQVVLGTRGAYSVSSAASLSEAGQGSTP